MSEAGEIEKPEAESAGTKPMRTRKRNVISDEKRSEIANRVVKFYDDEKMLRDKSARRPAAALCQISPVDRRHKLALAGCERCRRARHAAGLSPGAGHAAQCGDVAEAAGDFQRGKKEDAESRRPWTVCCSISFSPNRRAKRSSGELAEAFTNDPSLHRVCPVGAREEEGFRRQDFRCIPDDADPKGYFLGIIRETFQDLKSADSSAAAGIGRSRSPTATNWTSVSTPTKSAKWKWSRSSARPSFTMARALGERL
jgi:hypothetical protein